MDYKLIISESAQKQIESAIDYIVTILQNPGAAEAVITDLRKAYSKIAYMPESISLCLDPVLHRNGYRKLRLEHHDYVLIFRIDENVVKIVGFFHRLEDYIEKFNYILNK